MLETILNRIVDQFGPVNLVLFAVGLLFYREWRRERSARDRDLASYQADQKATLELCTRTVLKMGNLYREAIHQFMMR